MTGRVFLVWWMLGHAAVGAILGVADLPLRVLAAGGWAGPSFVGALAALVQWLVLRAVVGLSAW